MGREVYRGEPGSVDASTRESYEQGVREGALGLLLFSVSGGVVITEQCQPVRRR